MSLFVCFSLNVCLSVSHSSALPVCLSVKSLSISASLFIHFFYFLSFFCPPKFNSMSLCSLPPSFHKFMPHAKFLPWLFLLPHLFYLPACATFCMHHQAVIFSLLEFSDPPSFYFFLQQISLTKKKTNIYIKTGDLVTNPSN